MGKRKTAKHDQWLCDDDALVGRSDGGRKFGYCNGGGCVDVEAKQLLFFVLRMQ